MHNLAISYSDMKRHADALKLNEETLAIQKRVLPKDHPDTLRSMHNLAYSYSDLNRHADALKQFEETLAIHKRVLPKDHPDTLMSMHNLAYSYAALNRPAEALKLYHETLAIQKRVLPEGHPDTLRSMGNLAGAFRAAGKFDQALRLLEEVLKLRKAKVGPDHSDTILAMGNLAVAYREAGKPDLAVPLFEEALKLEKVDGALATSNQLAMAYLAVAARQAWVGRDEELAATCQKAVSLAKDTKDATLADRAAKTCSLRPTDDQTREAALVLARRAVELGTGHPSLAYFQMARGMAEYRSGHYPQADAALVEASKLGAKNYLVSGTAAFYRAMTLFRQGKAAEARKLATEAVATVKPLPAEMTPPADNANADDLIVWLAYREARELIRFEATPPPKAKDDKK